MKKCLFVLIASVSFATAWNTILAESTADETPTVPAGRQVDADPKDSSTSPTLGGSILLRDPNRQTDSPDYPLFRPHARKYYPQKTARTAILLSVTLPRFRTNLLRSSYEGVSLSRCWNWIDSDGRIPFGPCRSLQ